MLKTQESASPQPVSGSVFWLSLKSDKEMAFHKRSDRIIRGRAAGLPGTVCTNCQTGPGFLKCPRGLGFNLADHLSLQPTPAVYALKPHTWNPLGKEFPAGFRHVLRLLPSWELVLLNLGRTSCDKAELTALPESACQEEGDKNPPRDPYREKERDSDPNWG